MVPASKAERLLSFGLRTFAKAQGNGQDAPIPAVRETAAEPRDSLRVFGRLPGAGARGRTEAGIRKPLTIPGLRLWRHTPRELARGVSNFDLPAQLHDPVRGNAEELGRIQGEVAQEDEQPIPPCQKNE